MFIRVDKTRTKQFETLMDSTAHKAEKFQVQSNMKISKNYMYKVEVHSDRDMEYLMEIQTNFIAI